MVRRNHNFSNGEDALPVRQCALTRAERGQSDLIRFVVGPSGDVVPDLKNVLPGRGAWVMAAADCIEEAARRNVFSRTFKQSVTVPNGLAEQIGQLLARDALQRLSLANKAGLVIAGFSKVEGVVGAEDVAGLLHAADAGMDGRKKLDRKYEAICRDSGRQAFFIDCFSAEQMSLALGRSNVVHAALKTGGAVAKFTEATARLQRYLAGRDAYEAA